MTTSPDQKPSAEVQAIVMNLWNVIRETAQATAAVHAENKAFAQKHTTLGEQMQQEHERHAKLQAYTEHLQMEVKQHRHDLDVLQQQHQDAMEISLKREETVQELRRILIEQEELVAQRGEENKTLTAQLALAGEGFSAENGRLQASIENIKHDLSSSRQQALHAASEVDELRDEVESLSAERNQLLDDNEQLRWRLDAFEKNTAEECTEQERKLEAVRLYSGEITAQLEDAKRLTGESDARISALTTERISLREAVEKTEQEALTWQQIAEEQTQTIEQLRAKEQDFSLLLEQNREEASSNLAYQLTSTKNLYETALDNLKAQLQEERLQHQQTLDAHVAEQEKTIATLEEQIGTLAASLNEQTNISERLPFPLGESERLALTEKITHLLRRVEAALE